MTFFNAFRAGLGRVGRAPAILAGTWFITALFVLPIALQSDGRPATTLSSVDSVDFIRRWHAELERETIETVLDLGPAVRVAAGRPIAFARSESGWMVAFTSSPWYLIIWLFLSGGIIDRYARDRPTRAHGFFGAAGVFFGRFLRLAPAMVLVYGAVVYLLRPRPAALWLALAVSNLFFDYAQVRSVVEDRRSMLGAMKAAALFIWRNPGAVLILYAIDCAVFAAIVGLYTAVGPVSDSAGAATRSFFVIEQLYVLARLWARLLFWATEIALFQGRLAHAGYVASPARTWPDSPDAEAIGN